MSSASYGKPSLTDQISKLQGMRAIVALSIAGLALQACSAEKMAQKQPAPLYSADFVGKAPLCTAPAISVADGKEAAGRIATGGGGWCGFTLNRDGSPYASFLLTDKARFGKVLVHTVGDDTRIDYTPNTPTVTADAFSVRLIPGDAIVRVAVAPAAPGSK